MKDIRWKQRYENFQKSFLQLKSAVAIANPKDIERAGLIQFFEITFELGWKTLKDYLEAEGFVVASPRGVIKQAFQSGFIVQGHVWMEALDDRNLTTHMYDEATSHKVEKLIKEKYFPAIKELDDFFQKNLAL